MQNFVLGAKPPLLPEINVVLSSPEKVGNDVHNECACADRMIGMV